MKHWLLLLLLLCIGNINAQTSSQQSFYKKVPKKIIPVNDYAGLLSKDEIQLLSKTIKAYRDSTNNIIVIITQNSLTDSINNETYSVEEAALHYFNTWKIGDETKNNGVLIFVAKNDRKVRIATGKGIEDVLTNNECEYIITNNLVPNFKQVDYFNGLSQAVDAVINILSPPAIEATTYDAPINTTTTRNEEHELSSSDSNYIPTVGFFGSIIVIIIVVIGLKRRMNSGYTYLHNNTSDSYYRPYRSWWNNNPYNHQYNDNSINNDSSSFFSNSYQSDPSSSSSSSSNDSYGGVSSDGDGANGSW